MFNELYQLVGEELHSRINFLIRLYPQLEETLRRIESEIESSRD